MSLRQIKSAGSGLRSIGCVRYKGSEEFAMWVYTRNLLAGAAAAAALILGPGGALGSDAAAANAPVPAARG